MGWTDRLFSWNGGSNPLPAPQAVGPVPENVVDGRHWGDEFWDAMRSTPVEANTAEAAARTSAVAFCTSIIAEAVGSLSVDFVDSGNHKVDLPMAEVIALEPNPLSTAAEFWAAMAYTACLRGIAFAEPTVGVDNVELWQLDPRGTTVEWEERRFSVLHTAEGRTRRLAPQQLFLFSGLADATLKPLVPWRQAKGSIDFELALESGARQFFRNNLRFNGVLSTDHKLTDEGIEHIRAGIGRWKQGGIPILEQGLSFSNTTGTNADAQLTELIKQRTLEMARYWRIPRSMIGEDSGSATSQEQEALAFVKYTMRPWTKRIEQAVTVRLLPPDARAKGVRAKFNLDSLLRGDSATQWRNAVLARTAGILSVNTIGTDWFGQPRIEEEWADDPRAPLNSNRAADTVSGGMTAPQDRQDALQLPQLLGTGEQE
jgi:HK97 family phage portal protein